MDNFYIMLNLSQLDINKAFDSWCFIKIHNWYLSKLLYGTYNLIYDIFVYKKAGGIIISRQNLNEYLETLHLAPTQFCDLTGFNRKTGFLLE